jgi:hypothetical protein
MCSNLYLINIPPNQTYHVYGIIQNGIIQMADELKKMLTDNVQQFQACHAQSCMEDGGPSFLNKVILPIYSSLAEVCIFFINALFLV